MNTLGFILKWHFGPNHNYSKNELYVFGFILVCFFVYVLYIMAYLFISELWKKTTKQRYYLNKLFWYSVILVVFFSFVVGITLDLSSDSPLFWCIVLAPSLSISGRIVYKEIKNENKN